MPFQDDCPYEQTALSQTKKTSLSQSIPRHKKLSSDAKENDQKLQSCFWYFKVFYYLNSDFLTRLNSSHEAQVSFLGNLPKSEIVLCVSVPNVHIFSGNRIIYGSRILLFTKYSFIVIHFTTLDIDIHFGCKINDFQGNNAKIHFFSLILTWKFGTDSLKKKQNLAVKP